LAAQERRHHNGSLAWKLRNICSRPRIRSNRESFEISKTIFFFGLTPTEFRRVEYDFAEANNLKNKFNSAAKLAVEDGLY
jgi:hypothetical protein